MQLIKPRSHHTFQVWWRFWSGGSALHPDEKNNNGPPPNPRRNLHSQKRKITNYVLKHGKRHKKGFIRSILAVIFCSRWHHQSQVQQKFPKSNFIWWLFGTSHLFCEGLHLVIAFWAFYMGSAVPDILIPCPDSLQAEGNRPIPPLWRSSLVWAYPLTDVRCDSIVIVFSRFLPLW